MANITTRLKAALTVFRHGYPARGINVSTKAAPFMVWPENWQNSVQWKMIDLQSYIDEGFSINTLIYSAVMYKARASIAAPLRAYEGGQDKPQLLPDTHPLTKLVSRPNPNQSWPELQMLQDIFLNLAGECYTWYDRKNSVSGVPSAAYSLNPLRVYIIPGTKGTIKGYWYVPTGASFLDGLPLLPQDISHVKLPNPGDPLDGDGYGFSPMSPLARSGDVDNMITRFLQVFFQRGAVPAGVLKFSMPLNDPTVATIKERWKDMYGGYEKWSDIGVLDQTGEYQRIGMNFDELGFDSLDERNESRILGPFGVPPILIGSRIGLMRSTYSNFKEARQQFWEDTMLAEMTLFETDFKYYMQSDDGGYVAYDFSQVPALRKDTPALVTAWAQLFDRGVPRAAAAEAVGLSMPDLPDNNISYMPPNLIPVGGTRGVANSSASQPEATEDARPGGKELPYQQYITRLFNELRAASTASEMKDISNRIDQAIALSELTMELKLAREALEREEKG